MDFTDHLAELTFNLHSNRAINTLKSMREHGADLELVRALGDNLFHAVEAAKEASRVPGTTWEPSPQRMAKLLYREAVACRLIGSRSQAMDIIEQAIRKTPDDPELQRESNRE